MTSSPPKSFESKLIEMHQIGQRIHQGIKASRHSIKHKTTFDKMSSDMEDLWLQMKALERMYLELADSMEPDQLPGESPRERQLRLKLAAKRDLFGLKLIDAKFQKCCTRMTGLLIERRQQ